MNAYVSNPYPLWMSTSEEQVAGIDLEFISLCSILLGKQMKIFNHHTHMF